MYEWLSVQACPASKFGRPGAILGETSAEFVFFRASLINFLQPLLVGADIGIHSVGNRYVTSLSVAKIICANCTDKRMSGSKTGLLGDEEKVQWK
ncbi:hypothetical protein BCON_0459g00050 [Botryotinia convoluta]|uniref:Uncharacterized protein n=1 Tax=Botryotinia convoluta TaxID=54673 RepID=A0A4Z1H9D7_9HELO|nr:hypothetical protein BCON_0459g00050 [Botryotinia convoluta]